MCRGSRVLGLRLAMWLEPGFARLLSSQSAAVRRGTACTEYGQTRTYRGQPNVGRLGVGSRMMDAIIVSLAFDFPVHGMAGLFPRYEPSGMVVFTSVCPREASRHTHGFFVWGTANHKPGSIAWPATCVKMHGRGGDTLQRAASHRLTGHALCTRKCAQLHDGSHWFQKHGLTSPLDLFSSAFLRPFINSQGSTT
ncbi:hypothetical protein V8C44DRAFT_352922 [Trichoderma aethiopicum]